MPSFRTLAAVCLLVVTTSAGAEVVRSPALINSIPVQGITLQTSPRQAFEHMMGLGYKAGNIKRFEDWGSGRIEFYRPGAGPMDESRITLSRRPGVLLSINEITSQVGER